MPATVTLAPESLPDVKATKHDDGSYEVAITGLAGLDGRTIDRFSLRQQAFLAQKGVTQTTPPTVRLPTLRGLELAMLLAVEQTMPDELLDNVEGTPGALDKEHLLLDHIIRTVRLALIKLEPPA